MSGIRRHDETPRPTPPAERLFDGKDRDLGTVEGVLRPGKAYVKGKSEPPRPW